MLLPALSGVLGHRPCWVTVIAYKVCHIKPVAHCTPDMRTVSHASQLRQGAERQAQRVEHFMFVQGLVRRLPQQAQQQA